MTTRPLLLTGYGSFPGVEHNPTATIARALQDAMVAGHRVQTEVLPVSYAQVPKRLRAALDRHTPLLTVHLGVAIHCDQFRVESTGVNRAAAGREDIHGSDLGGGRLVADRPLDERLLTALDVAALASAAETAGYPARASDDAGRYLCNAALYTSLVHLDIHERPRHAIFLHTPPVGATPMNHPAWDMHRLCEATVLLIAAAVHQVVALVDQS